MDIPYSIYELANFLADENLDLSKLMSTQIENSLEELLRLVLFFGQEDILGKKKTWYKKYDENEINYIVERNYHTVSSGDFPLGNLNAKFSIIYGDINSGIEINLIINADTKYEDIRTSSSEVSRLQSILYRIQGEKPKYSLIALKNNYYQLRKQGKSYGDIAKIVNNNFIFLLASGVFNEDRRVRWLSNYYYQARLHLKAMMVKDKDIDSYIDGIKFDLESGNFFYNLNDWPVTYNRARESIREWERKIEKEKILIIRDLNSYPIYLEFTNSEIRNPLFQKILVSLNKNMEKFR